jgi:outer membrane protein, adhesin transport system
MKRTIVLSAMTLACGAVMAQNAAVTAAAQKAIEGNPDVAAKFNAFRASIDEIDVQSGALKPRVDISADAGRENTRVTSRSPEDATWNRTGAAVTISQLLWDGFGSRSEVGKARHTKLARYFDFVDATEQAALEAGRAYFDVQRYRTLVALAEQNYVQHRYAFDQIQSKVKAGVSRGVDQEQAAARLALADSNLITERANLHDVMERYRRIVGELPPAQTSMAAPALKAFPASQAAALDATPATSPVIASAVENLRAVKSNLEGRKSAYQPRVEARLRAGVGNNLDGSQYERRDVLGQIVLNWNIFNGGADDARQRQAANLLSQAMDLRDKACRDTRQTVAIAYNDVGKLTEQLGYLERNVAAIEKARDAYRQQFDIGQRSLLDLLNAENEVYTARRAYAVAMADLDIAKLRTYAGMGNLVSALGLARDDARSLASEADNWSAGDDGTNCPMDPTPVAVTPHAALDAKARALIAPAPLQR